MSDKFKSVEKTAKFLSKHSSLIWYVCGNPRKYPVAVSENDLARYMRAGYKIHCAFYEGLRYKNAYREKSRVRVSER